MAAKKPLIPFGLKAFPYYLEGGPGGGAGAPGGGGGGAMCFSAQPVTNMAHIAASVTMLMIFFFIVVDFIQL